MDRFKGESGSTAIFHFKFAVSCKILPVYPVLVHGNYHSLPPYFKWFPGHFGLKFLLKKHKTPPLRWGPRTSHDAGDRLHPFQRTLFAAVGTCWNEFRGSQDLGLSWTYSCILRVGRVLSENSALFFGPSPDWWSLMLFPSAVQIFKSHPRNDPLGQMDVMNPDSLHSCKLGLMTMGLLHLLAVSWLPWRPKVNVRRA